MSLRSIERALSILNCFQPKTPILSLNDICRKIDLPKTTTFRILQCLVDEGYMINTADSRFQLSMKILRIADCVRVDLDMVTLARPALEELAEATGETIALSLLDGDHRVVVDIVECTHLLKLVIKRGERNSRHTGATGMVFLAYDQPELDAYLKRHSEKKDEINRAIQQVRAHGYTATTDFRVKGSAGVAAPLFDRHDQCHYSIGVYGPATRITPNLKMIVSKLVPVAKKVSQLAGSRRTR